MTLPHRRAAVAAALFVAAAGVAPAAEADSYWVFFGTYTGGKSKGIYRSRLDPKTGSLSQPELAAEATNPSFVAVHPKLTALYAVGEVGGAAAKKDAGVTAYAFDPKTGAIEKKNGLSSGGAGPCHVSVNPAGEVAVAANYGGGSCAFYALAGDGGLAKQIAFFQHTGSGPNEQRQEKAHGHCGRWDPAGRTAFVVDLGIDRVKVYTVQGGESVNPAGEWVMPAGSGPRHVAVSPAGGLAFVNGELDSTVHVVSYDLQAGTHKVEQTVSTLPGGNPVKGNSTAEVVIHPSGKFVYVSNRGHNSVAAFRWDAASKRLTPVGHATADRVKTPRNFNIDPTGRWMLVASQDADNVRVFEIDPESGMPKPTQTVVEVGKPVCVLFVPVAK